MTAPLGRSSSRLATWLGLFAIVLWSTSIAGSRSLTEQLGTFTAGAVVYLVAGLVGCGWLVLRRQIVSVVRHSDRRYLWGCGGLMACYSTLLYLAVGLSPSRAGIVAVTVANYLWPTLTLVLSLPILQWSARLPQLLLGTVLALTGVGLALAPQGELSVTLLTEWHHLLAISSAVMAALAWGIYSNISRRWGSATSAGAVPVFLVATGLSLLLLRLAARETSVWTTRVFWEVGYVALFPTLIAYACWDLAVRRGNLALVAAASYLTPILSVAISGLYLGLKVTPVQWLASFLVVAGAIVCKLAVCAEQRSVEC
jgi:drug/metabolite transporter (DMT)-like permease